MGTMREILFRAKRVDNGEWVEGFLLIRPMAICIGDYSPWWIDVPPVDPDDDGGRYNIDPETVGQYTGLTANDKRIFEGDIVNGLFLFERPVAGVVTFRDGSFGVQWMRGRVEEFSAFTSCCNVEWEVIGNAADNPELLEGGVDDG